MVREKEILKGTPMTPVGMILVVIGLLAAYQTLARGPAFIAALIAVGIAIVIRSLAVRASDSLAKIKPKESDDPWAKTSRSDRRLLARNLKLTMAQTTLSSLYPKQASQGYAIAGRMFAAA